MTKSELKEVALISIVFCLACCATQQYEQEDIGMEVEGEMVVLESQEYDNGVLEVCILNAGGRRVIIDEEYKNRIVVATGIGQILEAHDVTCFTLQSTDYSVGDKCRLVTKEGTEILFTVKR
jgi:hypothetical protein